MSRYIDAETLSRTFRSEMTRISNENESISKSARLSLIRWVSERVYHSKTADVVPTEFHDKCMQIEIEKRRNMVEVVRCKECKWYDGNECLEQLGLVCARDEDFCSWGERRENGEIH